MKAQRLDYLTRPLFRLYSSLMKTATTTTVSLLFAALLLSGCTTPDHIDRPASIGGAQSPDSERETRLLEPMARVGQKNLKSEADNDERFSLARKMADFAIVRNAGVCGSTFRPNQKQDKLVLPEGELLDMKKGLLRLSTIGRNFIVYKSAADQPHDRLIIDNNDDKDLANNQVFTLTDGKWEVEMSVGLQQVACVARYEEPFLRVSARAWLEGKVTVAGKECRAAVIDRQCDGNYAQGDFLWIDMNGTGSMDRYSTIGKQVTLDGKLYSLTVAVDNASAELVPYKGGYASITLSAEQREKFKDLKLIASAYRIKGREFSCAPMHLTSAVKELPVTVPADSYNALSWQLADSKGKAVISGFEKDLKMPKGSTIEILSGTLSLDVTVAENNGKLGISMSLKGASKLSGYIDENGVYKTVAAPSVEIFTAGGSDKPIHFGHMEYG